MEQSDYDTEEFFDYIVKLAKLAKYLEHYDDNNEMAELFRHLHSVKAITYYYNLEEISILIEKTETIIMFISNYDCNPSCISAWLVGLSKQLDIWVEELKREEDPSFFDVFFEEMPTVECTQDTSKIIKSLNIIVSIDTPKGSSIFTLFKNKFKYVYEQNSIAEIIQMIKQPGKYKIITNTKFVDGTIIDFIRELKAIDFMLSELYLIVNFNEKNKFDIFRSKIKLPNIINMFDKKPDVLVNYTYKLVKSKPNIIQIPNNNISLIELSKDIKPLSKTVQKLKEMCFGSSDIREISSTIKTDPMLTAILIKSINTPFIGLPNRVSKVGIAVSLMGKKRVGAIVMSELARNLSDDEALVGYNISLDDLMSLSQVRARFVTEWLKYIDIPTIKKEYIASLIHLMPIGIILANKALVHNKTAIKFNNKMDAESTVLLERQMLGWSNIDALSKIFILWNMPSELIKLSEFVASYEQRASFKDMNIYAVIVILATQVFRIDGVYCLEKTHLRFASANNLVPIDMKNIFNTITSELPDNIYDNN